MAIKAAEKKEEGWGIFSFMAFVFSSRHYMWWSCVSLDMAEQLSDHRMWGMNSLFCFAFLHRFYFTYKTVFLLSRKMLNFYPSHSLSFNWGKWMSSFLQGLNHNRWWDPGFQGGQCSAMQSTVSHLGLSTLELTNPTGRFVSGQSWENFYHLKEGPIPNVLPFYFKFIFALEPTSLGRAHFVIYKTDYKESRGPGPTDRARAADQWQTCIDWNIIKPKRWKQTRNVMIFFLCVCFLCNKLCYSRKMELILLSLPNV